MALITSGCVPFRANLTVTRGAAGGGHEALLVNHPTGVANMRTNPYVSVKQLVFSGFRCASTVLTACFLCLLTRAAVVMAAAAGQRHHRVRAQHRRHARDRRSPPGRRHGKRNGHRISS